MILKRVLKRLRQHWPETRILLRGDAHFANVELMQLALDDPYTDFLFGLAGNSRLKKLAEPHLQSTRRLHDTRCHNARLAEQAPRCTDVSLRPPELLYRAETRNDARGAPGRL